jgi:hypothetical protein
MLKRYLKRYRATHKCIYIISYKAQVILSIIRSNWKNLKEHKTKVFHWKNERKIQAAHEQIFSEDIHGSVISSYIIQRFTFF